MNKTDKVISVVGVLALVLLLIMINTTTPSDVGPLGVLVFFTLFYLVFFGVAVGLCRLVFWAKGKMIKGAKKLSRNKSYYYGSVLAFVPMILVFMRSFGGLNIFEVVLVVLFAVVGCFFISKKA